MSTKLKYFKNAPFYFSPLFLVLLSSCSIMYGIPFIIALILVYLRQKKWHTVEITELIELGNIQDKIEEQTKRLAMLQSEYAKRVDSYQGNILS